MVSRVKLAVGTRTVTRASVVTQGDFSLTFDRDVLLAETIDGVVCIHSNGASIIDYTPGEVATDSATTQNISKNLAPFFSLLGQGVDARAETPNGTTFSEGKILALPDLPSPGDSIVLQKAGTYQGAGPVGTQIRRGLSTEWASFLFSDALPPPGHLSGSVGWWNLKEAVTYAVDIEAKVATLPSLSLTGVDYPPVADVIERLDRNWGLAPLTFNSVAGSGYECWVPQAVMSGLKESNYGEYLAVLMGAAGDHLIGDVATTEQKTIILRNLAAIGCQIIEGGRGVNKSVGGPNDSGLGGHNQWEFIPMLCYLWLRDLEEDLDNLGTLMPTCILGQPFLWTSDQIAQLAPHDDPAKIGISRRREITAVSGTTITYETYPTIDIPRMDTRQLLMTRESDGATAVVTTVTETLTSGGTQQVTIDVQPGSPFEIGDVIYFQAPYTINEGDADWRIAPRDSWINPSPDQTYRIQQMWLDEILFPHALGIWRSDWDAAKDYVVRCMNAADPAGHLFPLHWDAARSIYSISGGNYQFDKSMWDTHAATYGLL